MSDYWSGIFLLVTIVLTIFLLIIVLFTILIGKKKRYLNITAFGIVVTMLLIWIGDRFIVGSFCFPWECTRREIRIESLLLDTADLPENWSIRDTYNYAYVPRASSAYIERIFLKDLKLLDGGFIQEIYQYRSVRGASFQYDALKDDLPNQYSRRSEPILPQVNLQGNHAAAYVVGYIHGSPSICYYIARYDEYIVVLKMRFSSEAVPLDDFIKIVQLADEKLSNTLRH